MKTMNIFGRKISVVAVLIVALLVGTASAALISNYGTLTGTVTVPETIIVNGNGEGDLETIIFNENGIGTFTITNYGIATSVNVDTELWLDPTGDEPNAMVIDTRGIIMTYDIGTPTNPGDDAGDYVLVNIPVTAGASDAPVNTVVTVTFGADPLLETGVYTIQVEVNPVQ